MFLETGYKELIAQLVGFGVEKHDDLVDVLTMSVIELMNEERKGGSMWFFGKLGATMYSPIVNQQYAQLGILLQHLLRIILRPVVHHRSNQTKDLSTSFQITAHFSCLEFCYARIISLNRYGVMK